MTSAPQLRYEFKVPCKAYLLPQVEAWVRLHPAHWRVTYPPRQVNNVYFDFLDQQNLNDNLSGVSSRRKLRLRWYGTDVERVTGGHFELKCKEGLVGWKENVPCDLAFSLRDSAWVTLLQHIRRAVPERVRYWLEQAPVPTLINHYWRSYYETPDGVLRLTVDTRLRALPQQLAVAPDLSSPVANDGMLIIELKSPVNPAAYRRLREVLKSFPLRVERYSKYVQGMLAGFHLEG